MTIHPAGFFEATVQDHGYTATSTGKEQLVIQFETPHGGIRGFFFMTDAAAKYTCDKIRAIGFKGDDLAALSDGTAMRGMKCKIVVDHEDYQGKVQAKVNNVFSIDSAGGEIKRDEKIALKMRSFNALLKKAGDGTAPKGKVQAPRSEHVPGFDDTDFPPPQDDDFPPFNG